jgi:Zn-dependent alcohol dehydrogenase
VSQQSRAVVARELGLPVSVEQIKVQSPRHGEVMIRLAACGVCHSDLSATNGTIAYLLPLDRAALIACGVMTGFGAAVNTARVEAGSVAVVFGCGGVGLNAIQGCAIAGAAMIAAVDTSAPKLELAERFGATVSYAAAGQR